MNIESYVMIAAFVEMFKQMKKNKIKFCKLCFTTENLLMTNNQSGTVQMSVCCDCKEQYHRNIKEKQRKNLKEKYGVEFTFQIPGVREKIDDTMKERYGVENYFEIVNQNREQFESKKANRPNQKELYKERFGDDWYQFFKYQVETPEELQKAISEHKKEKSIRRKNLTIKKFGVENISQLEEVKEKKRQKSLEKYGVDCVLQSEEIKKKIKETNMELYGAENVFGSEEIKEKIRSTNIDRYGVEYPLQNTDILEKTQQTNITRYGFTSPTKSKQVKDKTQKTNMVRYGAPYHTMTEDFVTKCRSTTFKKYGVEHHMYLERYKRSFAMKNRVQYYDSFVKNLSLKSIDLLTTKEEYINLVNGEIIKCFCRSCNNEFEIPLDHHQRICCDCTKSRSSYENVIIEWLKQLGITNIVTNRRFYYDGKKWYDIDIFLPDHNLGIEFHGLYYHRFVDDDSIGKPNKHWHQNKFLYFEEQGIRLIQIFESEFVNKRPIVESIISNYLGMNKKRIHARKCQIRELTDAEYKSFLIESHLQGYAATRHRYGLVFDDVVVSVIGFNNSRFNKNYDYEVVRFCNKPGVTVNGGFNKLINHFRKIVGVEASIISYVDLRYFNGSSYQNWRYLNITEPNYFYFKLMYMKNIILENRLKYQKHKLSEVLDKFDPNLSEWENMKMNGFDKIYDAGNKIFVLE